MKFLFLLKQNTSSGSHYSSSRRSGLKNSATLVSSSITNNLGIKTKVETVVDGNHIDREVYIHKPTICFIEAIWVTPEKLRELTHLHPRTIFIVRVHSKTTFLANEGIALSWIVEYSKIDRVHVSFNNDITNKEYYGILAKHPIYLPNLFEIFYKKPNHSKHRNEIVNIGCFGAIRPMKNHLQQAVAAINYGDREGKIVHFHINAGRVEQKGENVLKNLRALFNGTKHKLMEHGWLEREEFLNLVRTMDIGMQVSLTESFNIVTADFVDCNIPIIVSKDIEWMPSCSKVGTIDTNAISAKIKEVMNKRNKFTLRNTKALIRYNYNAMKSWSQLVEAAYVFHKKTQK
jgi:hypothetical protein